MKMNGLIRSHWASFIRAFRRNPRRSWYQLRAAVRVTVQIAFSMWRANMYSHKIQTQLVRQRELNDLLETMLNPPPPANSGKPADRSFTVDCAFPQKRMFYVDPDRVPKHSAEM